MADLAKSLIRTGVQLGWGAVVAWLTVRHLDVPDVVTNWVTDTTVALAMLAVTAVIRFMETRSTGTAAGRAARWLAKVIMLGAHWRPKYTPLVAGRT